MVIWERAPHYWAVFESNLGVTLETLGERESGSVLLVEAISAALSAATAPSSSVVSFSRSPSAESAVPRLLSVFAHCN
jgi:hypothetical protein